MARVIDGESVANGSLFLFIWPLFHKFTQIKNDNFLHFNRYFIYYNYRSLSVNEGLWVGLGFYIFWGLSPPPTPRHPGTPLAYPLRSRSRLLALVSWCWPRSSYQHVVNNLYTNNRQCIHKLWTFSATILGVLFFWDYKTFSKGLIIHKLSTSYPQVIHTNRGDAKKGGAIFPLQTVTSRTWRKHTNKRWTLLI